MHFVFLFALSLVVFNTSAVWALSPTEISRVQAVSDEWRQTYKFDRATYDELQDSLNAVTESQALIERDQLDPVLRERLTEFQKKALQKVVNRGDDLMPYLLREFANTVANRGRDYSNLNDDARRSTQKQLRLREQAIEAAVTSIGLTAVPHLSDLQARALRKNSDPLASKIKTLLRSIVKREELELERMRLVGETPASVAPPRNPIILERDMNFTKETESPTRGSN